MADVETMSVASYPAQKHPVGIAGRLSAVTHPAAWSTATLAGLFFLWRAEHTVLTVPFAAAVVGIVAALLFAVSRRAAFSVYSAWLLIGTLTVISALKYRMKGFSFHFYDAVMLAHDAEVYRFLFCTYIGVVVPVLLLTAAAGVLAFALYRFERPVQTPLPARGVLLGLAAAALPATYPAEASVEQRYFYYLQGRHASAFFVSLLDMPNLFAPSALEERLALGPPQPAFPDEVECGAGAKPDIFVVLEESQTNPAYFPQIAQGGKLAAAMEGSSGALQPLHVEVFGGGTWISAFSLMTGLSATDFGWRSPYLTVTMENRVHGALPDVLSRCGYRTAAILPLNYTFVNEGPFLSSIGFDTVLDMQAVGAPSYHMRDKFYFDAAERLIAEHRKTDSRPLFLFMETMFPHSPYEDRLEPDLRVADEPLDANGQVAEYLRRMAVARADFAEFWKRRQDERAAKPAVVMTFGDHQSFATHGLVQELAGEDALAKPGSLAYRTFFTLAGGNAVDDAGPIDIPFLGIKVLEAAGIPGSPLFVDLGRLARLCNGAFYACSSRAEVDRHLLRRVAGGELMLDLNAAPGS